MRHGRERRGETRQAALKDQRGALRRRARGRGGLAANARLRRRLDVTRAAAAAAGVPARRHPADSPSSEQFTVSDVAVEYETDLRGDVDDEADGQLDADDAGVAGAGGS